MHPQFFATLHLMSIITMTPVTSERTTSGFGEHVLWENSGVCCSQEASKQLALSVESGDDPMYVYSPLQAIKIWHLPVNKATVILCVCVSKHTQQQT